MSENMRYKDSNQVTLWMSFFTLFTINIKTSILCKQRRPRSDCKLIRLCRCSGWSEYIYNEYAQRPQLHTRHFLHTKYIIFNHNCSKIWILTLVLLSPDMPYLCKQCRSGSVSFWRSQLIWFYTVCHQVCEFDSTTLIKHSNWLKLRSGCGFLIYSAWQRLIIKLVKSSLTLLWSTSEVHVLYLPQILGHHNSLPYLS